MANIDTSQFNDDLNGMLNDLPTVFTLSSVTYAGIFTNLTTGNNLEEGGFLSDFQATMHVKTSDLPSVPSSGQKITVDSVVYRIESVVSSPDGVELQLNLKTPDK